MKISIKQVENALLILRENCLSNGCENCVLNEGVCPFIEGTIPGNWLIAKKDEKVVL